jgi:histidinol-phosphate/aromatic aminotransferase/cobyric acid decarboxylase-like protein
LASEGDEAPALRAHGGLIDDELRALRIDPEAVLDVSVNVNPYGTSKRVLAAIRSAPVDRYPDPTAAPARRAIAEHLKTNADRVVLGNGAVDLLWTAARALLEPGATALVVEPAFSELGAAVRASGGRLVRWRAREEDGFAVDLPAVGEAIRREGARLVYLCSPANPTGVVVDEREFAAFAGAHPEVLFLFDQAFASLSDRPEALKGALPANVVALRSMTKEHAIAGVRVGYALAAPGIAARLERGRPPWSTSALAQEAAIAAIREEPYVEACRQRILADRDRLRARLREVGLAPFPSATLYFLLPVADAGRARSALLRDARVLTRDCTSFGLPAMLRICARPARDEERLVAALARLHELHPIAAPRNA